MVRDQDEYNAAEYEAIGLCISLKAVGDMVNDSFLELRDVSMYPGEVEVYFHSHIHRDLFIIRLLDFVKESGDSSLTGVSGSCLKVLQYTLVSRSFDHDNSIESLENALRELDEWLKYKTPIKLWLPTLDIESDIEVSRLDFIAISGNHCKHNLSRLTYVSKQIHKILYNKGYKVPLKQIPLALDDFQEHLQENFFIYYGTCLCEMLNNIRWGIQNYLQPIYYKVFYTNDDPKDIRYHFEYPIEVKREIPRQWFWILMNNIRTGPYFKKFAGAHYLKEHSSFTWRNR
jgi:hypothetical protein